MCPLDVMHPQLACPLCLSLKHTPLGSLIVQNTFTIPIQNTIPCLHYTPRGLCLCEHIHLKAAHTMCPLALQNTYTALRVMRQLLLHRCYSQQQQRELLLQLEVKVCEQVWGLLVAVISHDAGNAVKGRLGLEAMEVS